MRITNTMTANRMLLNINRNKAQVDTYYQQMASGKKIQYASENPIIGSRALKFRTTVAETQQYKRNMQQGYSFMEISEIAISNVNDMMHRVRTLAIQGATGTLTNEDRQKIGVDIQGLVQEIGLQMNQTYAGRSVFTGARTDEPAIFNQPNSRQFEIEQDFNYFDINEYTAHYKFEPDQAAELVGVNSIRLAYTGIEDDSITITDAAGAPIPVTIRYMDSHEGDRTVGSEAFAYKPKPAESGPPPVPAEAIYLRDTGELILHEDIAGALKAEGRNGFKIRYEKEGFQTNDLNPKAYFTCIDLEDTSIPPKVFTMDNQNLQFEFGANIRIDVNSLAKDIYTAEMHADFVEFSKYIDSANNISEERDLIDKFSAPPYNYTGTELSNAVTKQLADETQAARSGLQDRFQDIIKTIDKYTDNISKQRTDIGSRMSRLELIGNRLDDDYVAYTTLLSENEDVDYMETIVNLKSMDAIYQAAMNIGARLIQTSLVDFI